MSMVDTANMKVMQLQVHRIITLLIRRNLNAVHNIVS